MWQKRLIAGPTEEGYSETRHEAVSIARERLQEIRKMIEEAGDEKHLPRARQPPRQTL